MNLNNWKMSSKSGKRRRMEWRMAFRREDKIALIRAVQSHGCLWKTTNKNPKEQNAIQHAWKKIGAQLNKEAYECKIAWRSIRDSLRYHRSKSAKKISSKDSECHPDDWEFAKYLTFLPIMSSQNRNHFEEIKAASPVNESTQEVFPVEESVESDAFLSDSQLMEKEMTIDNASEPSISYETHNETSKLIEPKVVENYPESGVNKHLVGIIGKYFTPPKPGRAILPYWGELLNELPPAVARRVEVEITNLLHSKIKLQASYIQ
ncbi:uncharacterized protein LOC117572551 isoform X3 [Drosophila albomicans]|uniref:Uncharacterized protein LOC117572551 isoform X3 n=1 Tax=Drosophila albomicans TaxID=7291 RepID=A0A9C6T635_DROAB|nr:uncharacterized protein LOC117572551 isoform X3 [Drosophila albomicans]